MGAYKEGDLVHLQVIKGQLSIYDHENHLEAYSATGTIQKRLPLMAFDDEALQRFPYLKQVEAYEVEVNGEIVGALGWPEMDGEDYDVSDGLMYIAIHTRQIPSLIQGLATS